MKHRNTISRVEKTRKYILPMLATFLFIALGPMTALAGRYNPDDVSWQQTVEQYRKVPCLTEDQLEYGSQVLRGLNYNSQRIFRKMCLMESIDFEKSRQAWAALQSLNLSFEQTLSFEDWAGLGGINIDFAITALPEIRSLSYEAGKSFRSYLKLSGTSAHFAIKTIALLNGLEDANNRAAQGFLAIRDMDVAKSLHGMMILARLKDNQARACGEFAEVTDMNTETMLDALPLLAQLRQDDAWNARSLFMQESMTKADAWLWLVRYLATPPHVQESQFYGLEKKYKKQLLRAFYESGEELIWKINNLHAITDRFGFEISSGELRGHSAKQLRQRFEQLSPQVQFDFGKRFNAFFAASDKGGMITILRQATSADRVQTARDLTSANIYALLSQGSELYDSSFRDILAPILKKQIARDHKDDLLRFIQAVDPENMLVSSFIVSLAQKGKLTVFFPDDNRKQEQILDLVASSAFKDKDSILLFSATFVHLLEVLTPGARTFLLTRMSQEADSGSGAFSRLISVILQYYMQEYLELLAASDRILIVRLIIRHGAVDLNRYLSTPFAEWKSDGRLGSISVFHPDDDGRTSFYSNARTLLQNGYKLTISEQYSVAPLTAGMRQGVFRLLTQAQANPGKGLSPLFMAMENHHFSVAFIKQTGSITIRHSLYVYSGQENQQTLLERFLMGGDEMFAQRGHSYWRSEQITDPLDILRKQQIITDHHLENKQRFLSLGSCGGVKAYTKLTRLFRGHVDILATIGTGKAIINDPYNRNFFEVIAQNPTDISWKIMADKSAFIFQAGRGRDYLQPGSLTAILHKILDEEEKKVTSEDKQQHLDLSS